MNLPFYSTIVGKFGKKTGNILYIVLAVVAAIVAYRLARDGWRALKNLIGTRQERDLSDYLSDQIYETSDGVVPQTNDVAAFESEAQAIADMQHSAMSGPGTNFDALINQVKDLQGWQLVMVADAFGVRPYSNVLWSSDLNIFGWYDEELCDNCTTCLQYTDADVPGCTEDDTTFWCNGCTEREFMRKIWEKSGVPN